MVAAGSSSGGLGVSGDGVDQDDDVTFEAAEGLHASEQRAASRPGVCPRRASSVPEVQPESAPRNRRIAVEPGGAPTDPSWGTDRPHLQDVRRLQQFNQQARQTARRNGT